MRRALPFVKPALGVAPESIDDPGLARHFRYGVRSYAGLKEDVYAASFRPDPSILADLGVADEDILVTIRPPATEAHYHNPEAETLFVEVVEVLGAMPGVRMVILPRTAGAQREFVRRTWPRWCEEKKIIIPGHAARRPQPRLVLRPRRQRRRDDEPGGGGPRRARLQHLPRQARAPSTGTSHGRGAWSSFEKPRRGPLEDYVR